MLRISTIELVATDLDGTFVRIGQHVPSVETQRAMRDVHMAGVSVAAATARPYEAARGLFMDLGLTGSSIFDGGASIRDVETGELRWHEWLSLPRLKEVASLVLPHAKTVDFFPEYNMLPAREVSAGSLTESAPYAWAMVHEAALGELMDELNKLPNLNVHPGVGKPGMPGFVDIQITDVNANKSHALLELRRVLGVPIDRTLAIGDSSNDLSLFENAGTRVAMGNAIPELKALADHIVGTVEHDGWAEAMDRYVLA